jgi:ornithine cyclodeaminase/alanine dehydrogenase-like protein (mu-crystallin family)
MRILTAADVRAALPMSEAIAAVRRGFIALSSGQATVPVRSSLPMPGGVALYMPAYLHSAPVSTVKVVSVYGDNAAKNLPVVMASVLVLDAATGQPLALMDGTSLTALRTGAASGLATDLLAKADAKILGVIGAGAQAWTQIEAICAVRPIEEIHIYSLTNAPATAERLQATYPNIRIVVASSAHDALMDVDIATAATNSKTPVVHRADLAPGTHINGVGSFMPSMQEIAADVVVDCKIIVDHRESAWEEAGDLIIPRDQGLISEDSIHAELGEIAAKLKPGRTNPDEITFFKSVGNAVQDAATAAHVIGVAEEHNLGTVVNL